MSKSCVIIGAGMAGLSAGRVLQQSGWEVTLLDKGRTSGGRMGTRRFGGAVFDHGAQFITARSDSFQAVVDEWVREGVAREWFHQNGHIRYLGVGGMNSIPQHMEKGLDVRCSEHVESISHAESVSPGWRILTRAEREFQADAVIVTAPVEQSLAMLRFPLPAEVEIQLRQVRFEPCFALMALLDSPSLIPPPGYFRPDGSPIIWLADNQQKGISSLPAVTIHASADFTHTHWDTSREKVGEMLVEAARPWMPGDVVERQVHRWKYGMLALPLAETCLMVEAPGPLVFAGDEFGDDRVEGAWLSGRAAAQALLSV